MDLATLPLFSRLTGARRVLLAGAGGGFDVFTGIPLHAALRAAGKEVFLASLSFSEIAYGKADFVWVRGDTAGPQTYFPEKYLSQWYASRGDDVAIACFKPAGAVPVRRVYERLVSDLGIDALVLVDGGTDSLMRGDEPGLGTPAEDMVSIAAAHMLDLPIKLLVNLGFGVDVHHGVSHAYVLEAAADLTTVGGFLGAFSLLPPMPEFAAFTDAVRYVCERMVGHESIVATSIVAAGEGRFGDYHATERTAGSTLFINPLMSMYWCFELDAVARRCLYLDYLLETYDRWAVHRAIQNYLYVAKPRPWRDIPL